jgi:thioesterase domain-containing protein
VSGAASIEEYLHRHIPISRAMRIRVISAGEAGVRLAAELEPNLNHQSTAFGGSVSSLAILSAWTLAHVGLRERGIEARLVIQKSTVDFILPIDREFEAFCASPSAEQWRRFVAGIERRGRGRLHLAAEVSSNGAVAAAFHGHYVALA